MKVLMALGASTGGIGAHVASLTAALVDPEAQTEAETVRVLVWAPAATLDRADIVALADQGVRLVPVQHRWWRQRRLLEGADVVHAHGFHAGLRAVALLHHRARSRLVTTWHNLPPLQPVGARIAGRTVATTVARGSRLTLGASADLVAVAQTLGARDARLCAVSAPALPPSIRSAADVRTELGIDADSPIVLSVARFAPQKNLPVLLDAWALLTAGMPTGTATTPTLVVAGDGPLSTTLIDRVAAESLPWVRFVGQRSDVSDLLTAADVAVSSSDWEARSLVAQEALRAGVPFVGTAVGGVPELVGSAAVLVPAGDPPALAAGLRSVLEDPALADALREAGPVQATGWPDAARTAGFVRRCYADVLAGPATTGDPGHAAPGE